jgi:hypothetical protein
MMLSSANSLSWLDFKYSGKSFIYTRKRTGPELAANSDKNIQTDLIIMDFAKTFDKVPHQRLLYKLKFYASSQMVCRQSEVIFEK